MSSEIAIKVEALSKCYPIYDTPRDRLKQFVLPHLQRLVGLQPKQYYRSFWALKEVSFEVKKGETVGIIGRNGSGKSTLLQIICGTLSPTSGKVQTNGRIAALLELGLGFNPEFTGRENVYLSASIWGVDRIEIDRRFDEITAFAEIGDFIDQPLKTYSSGMSVRLAFAVAAHVDADILIIDEALAVGDFLFQQKCMRYLREFMKTGTVVFVSHDTAAVVNLCERAVWLDQGCVRLVGAAKDVCETYLAAFQESRHGGASKEVAPAQNPPAVKRTRGPVVDQRLQYLNASRQRNDIEVFRFDPQAAAYGAGGATIQDVYLLDAQGRVLSWIVGGETVILVIEAVAHKDIARPILGFYIKDRLGQYLFGDNTYLSYREMPVFVQQGETIEARFAFQMPLLPLGRYSVCAAIAEGTQEEHIQHHWIHDALVFESRAAPFHVAGLVGIPMLEIRLATRDRLARGSGLRIEASGLN
jgi:lipopolysaccharide transport system ATP-binding protein